MAHFVTIYIIVSVVLSRTLAKKSAFLEYKLCNWSEIVPEILRKVPDDLEMCKVFYPSGAEVNLGNYLTQSQTYDQPSVSWTADPSAYYNLILETPDLPTRARPTMRERFHWMVGNIPGNNMTAGQTIYKYIFPTGSHSSGLHRYIFLVYKQTEKVDYRRELTIASAYRCPLKVVGMEKRYRFEGLVAINFFHYRVYE